MPSVPIESLTDVQGDGPRFWQNPGMDAPAWAGQAGMETAPLGQIYTTGVGTRR